MAKNPVLFPERPTAANLCVLKKTLSEFSGKREIVGFEEDGLYVADQRVARLGHYEFPAKLIPWHEIKLFESHRCYSVKGMLRGFVVLLFGAAISFTDWVGKSFHGNGIYTLSLICLVAILALIFGVRRNRVTAHHDTILYYWTSPPLKPMRLKIEQLCEIARRRGVFSHVSLDPVATTGG